ncbi:hypothetical protein [Klebsiella michiganensis]|uniref:hypothetical protein n=1 Tax=Klebsiella michiganensis TaxID=1134687 RepID=UPI0012B8FB74|nr:hypothetical protein [Klebsiella michiganensis]EKV4192833.1 hypothetical protein [Klebsiella michiganensis]MBN4044207.1 hypothetical protein [Klebsiella michiganensis]MDH0492265.1 hypothetical protein [Klebsiella michiganensis]MDM6777429.1 hypothetical protein [Klebsiella michiganensis]HDF2353835.1 hypothetical protein [Klebsiella michiganensis]
MLFKELIEGNVISLPEGEAFTVTSSPEKDPVTGCPFIIGILADGSESRYFAAEDTLVTVVDDDD